MSGSSRDSQRGRQPSSSANPQSGRQSTTQRQAQPASSGARPEHRTSPGPSRRNLGSPGPPPNRPLPPIPRPNTPNAPQHETTPSQHQTPVHDAPDVRVSARRGKSPIRRKASLNLRSLAADIPEVPPISTEQASLGRGEKSTGLSSAASNVPSGPKDAPRLKRQPALQNLTDAASNVQSSSTDQPVLRRRKSSLKLRESPSGSRPSTPGRVNPGTTLSTEASEDYELQEKLKSELVLFPRRRIDPDPNSEVEADKTILVNAIEFNVRNMHHIRQRDPLLHQHLYRMNPHDVIPLRRFDFRGAIFLCKWMSDTWGENDLDITLNLAKVNVKTIFYAAIFAEKFRCPRFWNLSVQAIFTVVKHITLAKKLVLPLEDLVRIDERTSNDSPIRQMVYSSVIYRPDFDSWEDVVDGFDEHWRRVNGFWGSDVSWTEDHATKEFKGIIIKGLAIKQMYGAKVNPFERHSQHLSEYIYCDDFEEEEFPDPLAPALDHDPHLIRNTDPLPYYTRDGTAIFGTDERRP